ncbi:ATP-binding protein [Halomonas sp. AOP42-D1-22]|uniref:ATP-binding protein n=1 Tax=Halomonas sp. AOP42-D1-22 TaxID=3457667 RepID=UPI004033C6BC
MLLEREWPESFSEKVVSKAFGNKLCSYTISLEAWRRGLSVTILDSEYNRYLIESRKKSIIFNRSKCSLTTNEAVASIKDKQVARDLMLKAGVEVPPGKLFLASVSDKDVVGYAEEIGYPVVVKPLNGSLGRGVFTEIQNQKDLIDFFKYLANDLNVKEIIVEKHVGGDDYRAFVVGGKVVAAVKRIPANVVGDGVHSIEQLISLKNKDRKKNPFLSKGLIKKDKEVLAKIAASGYTLDSILEDRKILFLRGKANASAGGDVIDVTDTLPEIVKESAAKAISSIPGLEYCGVDVLYDELTKRHAIIEMNSRAQIGVNMYPTEGVGRNIPKAIIDHYFPEAPLIHEKTNPKYIFDLDLALCPIELGVAKSVTLAPIAKQNINRDSTITSFYRFEVKDGVNRIKEAKLFKLSEKLKADGFIRKERDDTFSMMISINKSKEKEFLVGVCETLKAKCENPKDWVGLVTKGFRFYL